MVCVPCLVVPVLLWVWFRLITPLLWKLKAIVFPTANKTEQQPVLDEAAKADQLKCPFAFCAKPTEKPVEAAATETKKDN